MEVLGAALCDALPLGPGVPRGPCLGAVHLGWYLCQRMEGDWGLVRHRGAYLREHKGQGQGPEHIHVMSARGGTFVCSQGCRLDLGVLGVEWWVQGTSV